MHTRNSLALTLLAVNKIVRDGTRLSDEIQELKRGHPFHRVGREDIPASGAEKSRSKWRTVNPLAPDEIGRIDEIEQGRPSVRGTV